MTNLQAYNTMSSVLMSRKRGGILFAEADNLLHAVDVDNQKMNDYTKERETCYNNSSLKGEHENGNHEKICTVLSSVS